MQLLKMKKTMQLICLCLLAGCSKIPVKIEQPASNSAIQKPLPNNKVALPQPVGPSEQLALNAMPAIKDIRTQNAVVNYSDAAKAWWIISKCNLVAPELARDFKSRLAQFTALMDMLLAGEFGISLNEANKYSQTIQMHALNDISANKFYGCGEKAKEIWLIGYIKTKRVTSTIQVLPPSKN